MQGLFTLFTRFSSQTLGIYFSAQRSWDSPFEALFLGPELSSLTFVEESALALSSKTIKPKT